MRNWTNSWGIKQQLLLYEHKDQYTHIHVEVVSYNLRVMIVMVSDFSGFVIYDIHYWKADHLL